MDLIVKLPISTGYNSILVIVDRYSKMAHFIPCSEESSAEDVANLLISNVFRLHGLPDEIVTDRGPQFVARFWAQLLGGLKIKICKSSARHPQSDGQTERVNQCLEQYLRCYVDSLQDNWTELLLLAEFSYNNPLPLSILGFYLTTRN
jgi:transposase InsO family protein